MKPLKSIVIVGLPREQIIQLGKEMKKIVSDIESRGKLPSDGDPVKNLNDTLYCCRAIVLFCERIEKSEALVDEHEKTIVRLSQKLADANAVHREKPAVRRNWLHRLADLL